MAVAPSDANGDVHVAVANGSTPADHACVRVGHGLGTDACFDVHVDVASGVNGLIKADVDAASSVNGLINANADVHVAEASGFSAVPQGSHCQRESPSELPR